MKYLFSILYLFLSIQGMAQYTFELKVTYAFRVRNDGNEFSVSGILLNGRIEKGKTYFLESGSAIEVKNIFSQKAGTSTPVANAPETIAIAVISKNYEIEQGDILKCVSTKFGNLGGGASFISNGIPEGILSCKVNGRVYSSSQKSKPVYIKSADMLELFFEAEDKSVIWMQLNNFSEIKNIPHNTKSDTSNHDRVYVCKLAYLPNGYSPTMGNNNYAGYEDFKGNAGIVMVKLDKYHQKLALSFSGILSPNRKMIEQKPNAGLFYITEGKIDNVGWDAF